MEYKRLNLEERLSALDEVTLAYYEQIRKRLLSFSGIKSRLSIRCDSYRFGRVLLAKLAMGGKSLKVFLAIDVNKEDAKALKIHFKDMSDVSAYAQTPAMVRVRSDLGAKKICDAIDVMMKQKGVPKKNKN